MPPSLPRLAGVGPHRRVHGTRDADAQIVWVGKAAYSANPSTAAKIKALAAKDGSYSELAAQADAMIHATDDIWVKY